MVHHDATAAAVAVHAPSAGPAALLFMPTAALGIWSAAAAPRDASGGQSG